MTRVQILAAAAVVLLVGMIAVGASLLHAPSDARQTSEVATSPVEADSDIPASKKGDRLPVLALPTAPKQSEPAPAAEPQEQLQAATDEDLRQADAERRRKRDVCPKGRTWFTIDHHQYWRCKR